MDVTKNNFAMIYPDIVKSLSKCAFISFDCEFTGIRSDEYLKNSLFDSPSDRYKKIRYCCGETLITQFGISLFRFDRDTNTYNVESYNCHISPQCVASIDQSFLFQASSLHFLRCHNFDFNKFIYDGIPYLSRHDVKNIQHEYRQSKLYESVSVNLSIEENALVGKYCDDIYIWRKNSDSEEMIIEMDMPALRFVLQSELQNRFPDIITELRHNKVIIKRTSEDNSNAVPENSTQQLFSDFLDEITGFSKIIEEIICTKKPLIGHNILYDLLLIYNQFIEPLPNTYKKFKDQINNLFPHIYDTKYISGKLNKLIKTKAKCNKIWHNNSLESVYNFFKSSSGLYLALYSPHVKANPSIKEKFHEAGWDSYCAGYVFVRIAHWKACDIRGPSQILGVGEHLSALRPLCNSVNLLRATCGHINLDKPDPETNRPNFLYVETRNGKPINTNHVDQMLSKFGSLDYKNINSSTILVAVAAFSSARQIVHQFSDNPDYKITEYDTRVNWTKYTIWFCTVGLGAAAVFFIASRKVK